MWEPHFQSFLTMNRVQSTKASPTLIMVDDDDEDIYLTRRAFCNHLPDLNFLSVRDGDSLFDCLYQRGNFADTQLPEGAAVILLDINIPRENGFEILKKLKADPVYCCVPIVMLTTSTSEQDIREAYKLGASSYLCKSVNASEMKKVANYFDQYWFDLVKIPRWPD